MITVSKSKGIYLVNNMEVVEDHETSTLKRVGDACRRQRLKAPPAENLAPVELKIVAALFQSGVAKNKVMEFVGPGNCLSIYL